MASTRSLAGLRRRNPLPTGTLAVGLGLFIAGVSAYGFLLVVNHSLSSTRYSALATFWALLFVSGNGIYMPFEQTLSRAIAARRVRGDGGLPVMLRAALIGTGLTAALVVAVLLAAAPISRALFAGDTTLVAGYAIGLVAYLLQFLARGALAGNGRFIPYGTLLALEGLLRVAFCVVLGLAHVRSTGPYGLALVVASLIAFALAVVGRRGLLTRGSQTSWPEVTNALGFLLVGSLCVQFLLSIGTVAVQFIVYVLHLTSRQAAAGSFLNSRVIAYIPIFLFQALQAAMLPRLSALAAAGRYDDFRDLVRQLLLVVIAVGVLTLLGFAALGPPVTGRLFKGSLSNLDFALLSLSCTGFMVGQVFGQSLIALTAYRRVAAGWTAGAAVFVVLTWLIQPLFLRVELGLLFGSIAAVTVMAAMLVPLLRFRHTADTENRIAAAET